jgi:FtsZ-binding cell division protein ZapB
MKQHDHGPSERDSLEPGRGLGVRGVIRMLATGNHPLSNDKTTNEELREEADRLRRENARLRAENRQLQATLDTYISRLRSTALFGLCEMTAGTSVGPPRRHPGR